MKKLKILLIPYVIPYPVTDGGKLCTFGFIDSLRNRHHFSIIFEAYNALDIENINRLKLLWPEVEIDYVSHFNENEIIKNRLFISSLMKKIANYLLIKCHNLVHKLQLFFNILERIPSDSFKKHNPFYNIERTTPFYPVNEKLVFKIMQFLEKFKYDIVQTDYYPNITLIETLPKEVKSVFVLIESRFKVLNDYAKANNFNNDYYKYVVENTQSLEEYYMSKYDAILTLNESDKEFLKDRILGTKIFSSPFGMLDNEIISKITPVSKYEKLILLGSDNHYPNLDSLEWYASEILPILIKKFSIKLHIIGKWSIDVQNKYKANPHICFEGFVESLKSKMDNSILIVPIRIGGGGIRTKILSAMAIGVPVISTDLASIGIESENKPVFLSANSAVEFVQKIEILMLNPDLGNQLALNGLDLIKSKYSQYYTSSLREKYYQEIVNDK